jgi:hypothetical protein
MVPMLLPGVGEVLRLPGMGLLLLLLLLGA